MKYIKTYIVSLVSFFLIDIVWIGFVSRSFYQEKIGFILSPNPNWIAAFIFYFLYIVAVIQFVVMPTYKEKNTRKTVLLGTFFGFVSYGVYDLTNLATISGWPISVTFVDMVWGGILTGIVSYIALKVYQK